MKVSKTPKFEEFKFDKGPDEELSILSADCHGLTFDISGEMNAAEQLSGFLMAFC